MDALSGDFSRMVFKRIITGGLGEYSLDGQMLSILVEVDGVKPIGQIAENTGLPLDAVRRVISKLLQLKIVESVQRQVDVLDSAFLDVLDRELALAIGPIAEVVIEDAIADLGQEMDSFPAEQTAELIDYISQEIQREDRKTAFRQNMLQEMKQRGYI
jgi:DNA-binding transcriptional ArsR family regulator